MSRIGKLPVKIPEKVKVAVAGTTVKFEGPKGKMSLAFNPIVKVVVANGELSVTRPDESRLAKGLHGLTRTMMRNAIDGVTKGYERSLEVVGVGWTATLAGKHLKLVIGFANPILVPIPPGLTVKVEKQIINVKGPDRQVVGQFASQVRAARKPEPYQGKGIRYQGEYIQRKEGKKK